MKQNKGLSVVEYSMLIAIVVAALIGMQVYLKRAVSGNWKQAGDVFGFGRQYESGILGSPVKTTVSGAVTSSVTTPIAPPAPVSTTTPTPTTPAPTPAPTPSTAHTLAALAPAAPTTSGVVIVQYAPAAATLTLEELQNLVNALKTGDFNARMAAAAKFAGITDTRVITLLLELLKGDYNTFMAAVEAFRKMGDFGREELIKVMLGNGNLLDRQNAARVLGEMRDTRALTSLITALQDKDVRYSAIKAIWAIVQASQPLSFSLTANEITSLAEVLIGQLGDTNAAVRLYAVKALGEIKYSNAIEPLINALGDAELNTRDEAAIALGKIGSIVGQAAVDKLIAALDDSNPNVHAGALKALGMIGGSLIIESLKNVMINNGAAPSLRQAAASAFGNVILQRAGSQLTTTEADSLVSLLEDTSLGNSVKNLFFRYGSNTLGEYLESKYNNSGSGYNEVLRGLQDKWGDIARIKLEYGIDVDTRMTPGELRNTVLLVLTTFPVEWTKGLTAISWDISLVGSGHYDSPTKIIRVGLSDDSSDFRTTLFHEMAHFIDDVNFDNKKFADLYAKSDKSQGSGFKDFQREYGAANSLEDFATTVEGYTSDAKAELSRAITQAKDNPIYLEKIKIVAQLFSHTGSDGNTYTYLSKANTDGTITRQEVRLGTNGLPIIPGDVNGDGKVNSDDANLIAEYIVANTEFSNDQMTAADVNKDGAVDVKDSLFIVQGRI